MGQRQLVALMRVLVQQPAIFILDEATASIDPFTEAQIQEALELILADTTSLLIAHRLSTVRAADRIIVLRPGRDPRGGQPRRACSPRGGHYAELYNTYFRHQSLDYRGRPRHLGVMRRAGPHPPAPSPAMQERGPGGEGRTRARHAIRPASPRALHGVPGRSRLPSGSCGGEGAPMGWRIGVLGLLAAVSLASCARVRDVADRVSDLGVVATPADDAVGRPRTVRPLQRGDAAP